MRAGFTLCALALLSGSAALAQTVALAQTAAAPPRPAAPAPAPRPAPPYAVVEGASKEVTTAGTKLTVICPAGHRAFGAGYSALVRVPPAAANAPPAYAEGGLDYVRSMPDTAGTGWQVSGVSPDAVRLKQPWRLVVRVVCVQG